jgi:hypothetical protein
MLGARSAGFAAIHCFLIRGSETMHRHVEVSLIALALGLLAAVPGLAQERLDLSGLEINVHGGAAFLDAPEQTELFAGGTALLHMSSGVALGGTVDWVGTTEEVDDDNLDATLWYYSGELQYAFPSASRAQFYGLIGAGIARYQPGSDLEDLGAEDESDFMVPVGLGIRWLNDRDDPAWGATLEARDRVIYRDDEDTKVSSDWSIAFGLSVVLGG